MKAFVSMPLNAAFYPVWKAIKTACERNEIVAVQANQLPVSNNALETINREIENSDLAIVDFSGDKFLSFANPKVVAEARYARKKQKPILVITQSAEAIPMDWKDHREILYKNDEAGIQYLTDVLAENLEVIRQKLEPADDSPVVAALPLQSSPEKEYRRKTLLKPPIGAHETEKKIAVRRVGDIRPGSCDYGDIRPPVACHQPVVSPDGGYAVFQSKEDSEKIWIYDRNGNLTAAFTTEEASSKPKISGDGNYLMFHGESAFVKVSIYDKEGMKIGSFAAPANCYRPVMSWNGSLVILQCKEDERVWFYERSGVQKAEFRTPQSCYTPKISRNGDYIIFQSRSDGKKIWSYDPEGRPISSLELPQPCFRPKISPDGSCALYQSESNGEKIWIYDRMGHEIAGFETPEPCHRPTVSLDGLYLIFQSERENGKVWIYHRNGRAIVSFETPEPCHRAKTTPDGNYAAFYSEESDQFWLYDFAEQKLLAETEFHNQMVEDGFGRTIVLGELNHLMDLAADLGYEYLMRSDFEVENGKINFIALEGMTPKLVEKYEPRFENKNIFQVF